MGGTGSRPAAASELTPAHLSPFKRHSGLAYRGRSWVGTEPGYLAEVYRKIAVRYLCMAGDLLKWAERSGGDGLHRDWTKS
jgi:hypothetical protein